LKQDCLSVEGRPPVTVTWYWPDYLNIWTWP